MIVSNSDSLGGRSTNIRSDNFLCTVNTFKKALIFGGLMTMVYDMSRFGSFSNYVAKEDLIASLKYRDHLSNDQRLYAHFSLCEAIDELSGNGVLLKDLTQELCIALKEKNIVDNYNIRF
jgi:hypothetical protein